MKTLLLQPLIPAKIMWGRFKKGEGFIPPIGLISIAGYLNSKNYDITICDAQLSGFTEEDLINYLKKGKYDLIGIPAFTNSLVCSFKTAEICKKALPKASCMLMSPMDRGEKNPETGQIKSMRIVSRIVRAQREVSAEENCAFWSAYDAMGGRGSMGRWYKASPKLAGGDLTHPTGSGANRIGAMFFAALIDGYQRR